MCQCWAEVVTLCFAPCASQNQPSASSEEKGRKLKKKVQVKRRSRSEVPKEREDECFSCGDGGQIVSCKKPGCPKVYHADCLNLTKRPAGTYLCVSTALTAPTIAMHAYSALSFLYKKRNCNFNSVPT